MHKPRRVNGASRSTSLTTLAPAIHVGLAETQQRRKDSHLTGGPVVFTLPAGVASFRAEPAMQCPML